jgi:hypothetical protein
MNAGSRTRDPCLRSDEGRMSHLGTRACTYRVSGVPPSAADKIRVGSRPRSARLGGDAPRSRTSRLQLAQRTRRSSQQAVQSGCPRTNRSIRFRIDSDGRRRGCDTWMRVADSAALRSAQEPSAELPRPTERDPEGSAARAWQPRGVSLRLLPGTVTRAPEERHGQADLRGECVP